LLTKAQKDKLNTTRRTRYANDPEYRKARREAKATRYAGHRKHPSKLLTWQEYWILWGQQEGLCAICCKYIMPQQGRRGGTGRYGLVVDHKHGTTEVRGLLCSQCNTALGLLQDSPKICLKATQYLEQNNAN